MRAASACLRLAAGSPSNVSGPNPSRSSAKRAAQSAAGTTWRRIAFGRRACRAATSSSRKPGTSQSNPVGSQRGEQGQRDHDRHPVVDGARLEPVGEARAPGRPAATRREVALVDARRPRRRGRPRRIVEQVAASAARVRATTSRTSARRRRRRARGRRRTRRPASSPARMSRRRSRSSSFSRRRAQLGVAAVEGRQTRVSSERRIPLAGDQRVADEQLAGERRGRSGRTGCAGAGRSRRRTASPSRRRRRRRHPSTSAARCSCRFARSPASGSAQAGSIAATVRANRREVSTSSAAITARGRFLRSPEPGKIEKRMPRAPRYSAGARRGFGSPDRAPAGAAARCARRAGRSATAGPTGARGGSRPGRRAVGARAGPAFDAARRSDAQLAVHVEPLPHAHVVEVLGAAECGGTRSSRARAAAPQVVPEVQQGEEVARRVGEPRVQPVGLARGAPRGRSRTSWIVMPATIASTSRGSTPVRLRPRAACARTAGRSAGGRCRGRCG